MGHSVRLFTTWRSSMGRRAAFVISLVLLTAPGLVIVDGDK